MPPTARLADPETVREALARVRAWALDPNSAAVCPCCQSNDLTVVDRSARPYSEWYHLSCPACGLDETLHVPLAPPGV